QIGPRTGSVVGTISGSSASINANDFTYLTVKSADGRILENKDDVLDLLPTGANAPNIGEPINSSVCTFELNIDKLLEDFAIFDADTAANIVANAMNALTNPPSAVGSEIIWGDINVDYYYFVAVKTKKVETTADADIIGTFEFKRKAVKENGVEIYPEIKDEEHDFAINLWYDGNYSNTDALGETYYTVDDEATLKWDDMYILKFDSDDEVTLNFGYENEGEFTFDASGQGKMLINFNTNANEAICDANPGVEMFFVNFNGAKFNRTGIFEYEMENMAAAYEVVDGKLVEIKGLELDGDTATFATRTLGNYVFAAAELVAPVA
ncbi:MAG: hypothetical protein J6C75_00615, partial [Oscillospiraceae bacterium]|nr:hypothetical protein [Oscillospiraceae bacterium]